MQMYDYLIKELSETIENGDLTIGSDPTDSIYYIDPIGFISGDFCDGSRGLDHNTLLHYGLEWTDILECGVVIVPETQSYISDDEIQEFNDYGFTRLPLTDNHIVGFK